MAGGGCGVGGVAPARCGPQRFSPWRGAGRGGGCARLPARAAGPAGAAAAAADVGPRFPAAGRVGMAGQSLLSCKRTYLYVQLQFSSHHRFVRTLTLLNLYLRSTGFFLFIYFRGPAQEKDLLRDKYIYETSCRGNPDPHTLGPEASSQGNGGGLGRRTPSL